MSARNGIPGLIVVVFQEIGQLPDPVGDVFQFGMRVLHRHLQVGVTHGFLNDRDRHALLGEDRRMGMSQSMNVDDPIHGIAFFNACSSPNRPEKRGSIIPSKDWNLYLFFVLAVTVFDTAELPTSFSAETR